MWRPFDGVSFSRELFEKDLTEPTDEEDQAYKPAEPISEAHCGHRTEYATALSHDFSSQACWLNRSLDCDV
jgi:hypothetical protein